MYTRHNYPIHLMASKVIVINEKKHIKTEQTVMGAGIKVNFYVWNVMRTVHTLEKQKKKKNFPLLTIHNWTRLIKFVENYTFPEI